MVSKELHLFVLTLLLLLLFDSVKGRGGRGRQSPRDSKFVIEAARSAKSKFTTSQVMSPEQVAALVRGAHEVPNSMPSTSMSTMSSNVPEDSTSRPNSTSRRVALLVSGQIHGSDIGFLVKNVEINVASLRQYFEVDRVLLSVSAEEASQLRVGDRRRLTDSRDRWTVLINEFKDVPATASGFRKNVECMLSHLRLLFAETGKHTGKGRKLHFIARTRTDMSMRFLELTNLRLNTAYVCRLYDRSASDNYFIIPFALRRKFIERFDETMTDGQLLKPEIAWADKVLLKRSFEVPSHRVFRDHICQQKHQPFESFQPWRERER